MFRVRADETISLQFFWEESWLQLDLEEKEREKKKIKIQFTWHIYKSINIWVKAEMKFSRPAHLEPAQVPEK